MRLIDKDAIYLRPDLDVLFVALNPSTQSDFNAHYFSGKQSQFFRQLFESGLITIELDRKTADETVFGSTAYNYKQSQFGVIDLVPNIADANSGNVKVKLSDGARLLKRITDNRPKVACLIHSKVKHAVEQVIERRIPYGYCGRLIEGLETVFYCNYFPNGNNISTHIKIDIYKQIKNMLDAPIKK